MCLLDVDELGKGNASTKRTNAVQMCCGCSDGPSDGQEKYMRKRLFANLLKST